MALSLAALVLVLAGPRAAAAATYALESDVSGPGTTLNIKTQDQPGVLSTKLVLGGAESEAQGSVKVASGRFAVEFAAASPDAHETVLSAGDFVEVSRCGGAVRLPAAPALGDIVSILFSSPKASLNCAVAVRGGAANGPAARVNSWQIGTDVDTNEFEVTLVAEGVYEAVYLGSGYGWQLPSAEPVGRVCESILNAWQGPESDLVDTFYTIKLSDGRGRFRTYCSLTSGGWTMFESLDFQTLSNSVIGEQAGSPRYGTAAGLQYVHKEHLGRFRLEYDQALRLRAETERIRGVCNLNHHPNATHVQFTHQQFNFLETEVGRCTPVEELVITQPRIATHGTDDFYFTAETFACYNCEVPWVSNPYDHPFIKINNYACDDGDIGNIFTGYEYFGHYDRSWYTSACTSDATATTDYFMK